MLEHSSSLEAMGNGGFSTRKRFGAMNNFRVSAWIPSGNLTAWKPRLISISKRCFARECPLPGLLTFWQRLDGKRDIKETSKRITESKSTKVPHSDAHCTFKNPAAFREIISTNTRKITKHTPIPAVDGSLSFVFLISNIDHLKFLKSPCLMILM
jgi:hypothetical protein